MSKKINVKKTVENTLDRAREWVLGKYPSSLNPDLDIKIDVRYTNSTTSSEGDTYNFSSKPTCVLIQRGTTKIALGRNSSLLDKGWEKPAYKITIFTPYREKYRIFETLDGKTIKDEGNPFLLSAIQKDPDFTQYISFFTENEQENSQVSTQKWNLNTMMAQSRERQ